MTLPPHPQLPFPSATAPMLRLRLGAPWVFFLEFPLQPLRLLLQLLSIFHQQPQALLPLLPCPQNTTPAPLPPIPPLRQLPLSPQHLLFTSLPLLKLLPIPFHALLPTPLHTPLHLPLPFLQLRPDTHWTALHNHHNHPRRRTQGHPQNQLQKKLDHEGAISMSLLPSLDTVNLQSLFLFAIGDAISQYHLNLTLLLMQLIYLFRRFFYTLTRLASLMAALHP